MMDFFKKHWEHIISYALVLFFIAGLLWVQMTFFAKG